MADVDYSMPAFQTPQGNQGAVLAGIISRARQQNMEKQKLQMEQQQEQRQKQLFDMQVQQAGKKLAADTKFSQAVQGLDKKDPDYQQKYLSLMLQHAAETGQYGAGLGATINALKPEPQFQPLANPAAPTPQGDTGDVGTTTAAMTSPGSGASPAPASTPLTPPAGASPAPAASPWLQPPGMFGNKFIRGVPTPVPRPNPPPRAVVSKPGDVVLDPTTLKPVYTNTTALPPRSTQLPRDVVAKPGDVVFQGGKPVGTNTMPRSVSSKAKPAAILPLPKSKDDLEEGKVYQTKSGPGLWNGAEFQLQQ